MIRIQKDSSHEPKSWIRYRLTDGAKYSPTADLREALLQEQGYLCAYCMRRIPVRDTNSTEDTRIDHIKSRTQHPEQELDYGNMVICCPGAISGNTNFHCDKSKKDTNISFDVFSQDCIDTLNYLSDGTIKSSNSTYNDEINNILCLNNNLLKSNRKAKYVQVITSIQSKGWKIGTIQKLLDLYQSKDCNGYYCEYCGIVIYHLTKKIQQISAKRTK